MDTEPIIRVSETEAPCGTIVTTEYVQDGQVIRRDVTVKVSVEAMQGHIGEVH